VLVTLLPGASRDNLLKNLRQIHNDTVNLRGGARPGDTAQQEIGRYLEWAANAVRILGMQIAAADVDRLVLTRGYDRLLSAAGLTGADMGTQRMLRYMLSTEVDARIAAFDEAARLLQGQVTRWSPQAAYLAPDTSFYIRHEDKLREADFRKLLGVFEWPVRVLVPIAVVDELDRLKESKDQHVRWRAGHTLGVLDEVLRDPAMPGTLTPADYSKVHDGGFAVGPVVMDLLLDPPGHVRLPIADDEIVDRIAAVQPLAGETVTLVTYDTGMAMRGRAAGLNVIKPPRDMGPNNLGPAGLPSAS
jgi:hypothetical protein